MARRPPLSQGETASITKIGSRVTGSTSPVSTLTRRGLSRRSNVAMTCAHSCCVTKRWVNTVECSRSLETAGLRASRGIATDRRPTLHLKRSGQRRPKSKHQSDINGNRKQDATMRDCKVDAVIFFRKAHRHQRLILVGSKPLMLLARDAQTTKTQVTAGQVSQHNRGRRLWS